MSARLPRERLDTLVVAAGLAPSRERAQAIILAGHVRAGGQPQTKPGTKLPADTPVELIAPPAELRYVSRGGLKLERALDAFALDPAGLLALDVGASTGGFTDVLLRRNARRVIAVDVGQGQLAWDLRSDARVVTLERTNIRHLPALPGGELAECAVIDVSFISLRLVLPSVAALTRAGAWIVALIKPQFEAGKREADRGGGIIRDPAIHRRVLTELLAWCHGRDDLAPRGLVASPIQGRDGNHEYLLWLARERDAAPVALDLDAALGHVIPPPAAP